MTTLSMYEEIETRDRLRRSRRKRFLPISPHMLLFLFQDTESATVVCDHALPKDTRLLSVSYDVWNDFILLVLHSESFSEFPEGTAVPEIESLPVFRTVPRDRLKLPELDGEGSPGGQ